MWKCGSEDSDTVSSGGSDVAYARRRLGVQVELRFHTKTSQKADDYMSFKGNDLSRCRLLRTEPHPFGSATRSMIGANHPIEHHHHRFGILPQLPNKSKQLSSRCFRNLLDELEEPLSLLRGEAAENIDEAVGFRLWNAHPGRLSPVNISQNPV